MVDIDTLSKAEILALLRAARDASADDWLMIAVTFLCALRVSETLQLTRDSVVGEHLVVARLKRSNRTKSELLACDEPLLDVRRPMLEKAAQSKPGARLFPLSRKTFWRRMRTYGKAAGLPTALCHPHTLKHSVLSHLTETMSLREIQEISGHKSLGSLGIYLHPKADVVQAKFREAMKTSPAD